MGYKIKPGFQIMQNGRIYTAGCVLKEIEGDLKNLVEFVPEKDNETEKIFVDGLEKYKPVGEEVDKIEKPIMYDVNNIGIMDPINPNTPKRGRPAKE